MARRLTQTLLCAVLLPGLIGGIDGDGMRKSCADCTSPVGGGEWTAEMELQGDGVVTLPPMDALPFLHRGKCDDLPTGGLSAGLRRAMVPLCAAPSRHGVQGGVSSGAAGFSVAIQHPRLLI